MEVVDLPLAGLKLIKPQVFEDERGYFMESYRASRYHEHGIETDFVQDNHSFSSKNTVRGLHFQAAPGQAKLIRVAVGRIYDVAVDIRPDSPTYGQWYGVELDDKQHQQLYVPVGFAHGFCVLSDSAHVNYKVSADYDPSTEKGFRWDDPEVGVNWPVSNPIVSTRDAECPYLKELKL